MEVLSGEWLHTGKCCISLGYVVSQKEMGRLFTRCIGSLGDLLAHWEICRLITRCIGSKGDVSAHHKMYWL